MAGGSGEVGEGGRPALLSGVYSGGEAALRHHGLAVECAPDAARPAPESPGWREPRRLLLAFLALQLALKLALLWQYAARDPFFSYPFSDARVYDVWSDRILAGEPYGPRAFYHAPGYPALLAGMKLLTGGSRSGVLLIQLLAGTATLALLAAVATRLAGPWAGLLSAVLAGLHGPLVFHELKLLPTTWVLLGDGAVVLAAVRLRDRPTAPAAVATGLASGLLVVLYPARLLLVALGAAAWLLSARGLPRARRAGLLVFALAASASIVLPVAVRNRVVDGSWVLVSANFGDTLYQGNNAWATGSVGTTPELPANVATQSAVSRRVAEEALGRPATSAEVNRFWVRRTLRWIASDPGAFARLLGNKVLVSVSGLDYFDIYSVRMERESYLPLLALFPVGFLPLLALFLLGAALPGSRPGLGTVCVPLLANHAVLWLVFSQTRYRLPSVPWLAAAGAILLVSPPPRETWLRARTVLAAAAALLLTGLVAARDRVQGPRMPVDAFFVSAGDAHVLQGRWGEARRLLEAGVARTGEPRLLFKLAQVCYAGGDPAAAEAALGRRLEAAPADLDALDLLGRIRWGAGDLPGAEGALRQAVALDPRSRFHRLKLAETVARQGRTGEALVLLDGFLARWPGDAEALALRTSLATPGAPGPAPGSPPGSTPAR